MKENILEWQDQGILLSSKVHGENNVVVELLTKEHGRHSGLVRGGQSRKKRALLQQGNHVFAFWKARLPEHLGSYQLETDISYTARLLDDKLALSGISTLCALAQLLPEREPQISLYEAGLLIFNHIEDDAIWPKLLVRWELALLNELGFGLDLSSCAATGTTDNLIYVSPKSGRAVSAEAGEMYKDKLLNLPTFMYRSTDNSYTNNDLKQAFGLTGYFLDKFIFHPRGLSLPNTRSRFLRYLNEV